MIRLLLDNKPAVVKEGANFKFVIENQAFSDQGSYSLEIPLPLQGCAENQRIFGAAHRVEFSDRRYDGKFTLATELITASGDYKVVEMNEAEAKIQLLATKTLASYNSKDNKGNELFIDQIPLGDMLDECDLEQEIIDLGVPEIAPSFHKHPRNLNDLAFYFDVAGMWRIHAAASQTTCVCFPICSTASNSEDIANQHKNDDIQKYILDISRPTVGGVIYNERLALQPQLLEVMRRVYSYLGFGFKSDVDVMGTYTFIANSRCSLHYADILPHWTINEFITEVCNFLDAIVIIEGTTAHLMKRRSFYDKTPQKISAVVDEHTIQCEDESAEGNSSTGNVDYEWPAEDPQLRLPEEVWEHAEIKSFPSKTQLDLFAGALTSEEKALSRYVFIDNSTNRRYAFLQNDSTPEADFELRRVDWYQPLIRNKETREIQTSLKIVPVRMRTLNMGFITDITIMAVEDVIQSDTIFSVNNTIKPSSEAAQNENMVEKRDVIEVFYHNGRSKIDTKFIGRVSTPLGVMLQMDDTTGLEEPIPFYESSNIDPIGPYPLEHNLTISAEEIINTKQQYEFKFILKDFNIDINRPFLIKNRKFICKKLEYICNTDGCSRLIAGTFYELL